MMFYYLVYKLELFFILSMEHIKIRYQFQQNLTNSFIGKKLKIESLTVFLAPYKEQVERMSLSVLIPTALRARATITIASLGVAFV